MSEQFDFTPSEHFFDEVLAFSLPYIGAVAIARFPELKAQVRLLIARYNVARKLLLPKTTISNIVIPQMNAILGNVASATLMNCQEVASNIQEGKAVTLLSYVDEDLITPMPGERVTMPAPPSAAFERVSQVAIGAAYERVKDVIEAGWGKDPWSWPQLLQYFRHCRNASFHGNRFNIVARRNGKQQTPGINPANPPTWRGSIMPDDRTMNARHLMGDWLEPGDVPILLGDVRRTLPGRSI